MTTARRAAAAAGPIPGEPGATAWPWRAWSGAPSCASPTCGPNPRVSVWRPADPYRPGASSHPASCPTTTHQADHVLQRDLPAAVSHAIHQAKPPS
jgi:hypothetical protein